MLHFFQDPLDFEWSFWTEWGRKSLLWTLAAHGVLSGLMNIFCPKVRSKLLHNYISVGYVSLIRIF